MIARLKDWIRRGGWSSLLELFLIAALGISLAHWTWAVLAPRPIAASTLAGQFEAQRTAAMLKRNLFGAVQEGKAAAVVDASPTSSIRLLGILSRGAEGGGRAIFALESGRPKTVEAGSQIVPGLVLKEVQSDHVLVSRSGLIERMKLDRRAVAKK
jgi:type II secretory pathway component PulC